MIIDDRRRLTKIALAVSTLFVLSSCATAPPETVVEIQPKKLEQAQPLNIEARKKLALTLQSESNLHDAQLQWRILLAIDPENTEYKNRLRVLQALIQRRAKNIIQQGHNALAKGSVKDAERSFLSALVIDPFNIEALESLRNIQKRTLLRLEEIKFAKANRNQTADATSASTDEKTFAQEDYYYELGTQLFQQGDWVGAIREIGKYLSSHPDDKQAREYFSIAHFQRALSQNNNSQFESALKHLKEAIRYASAAPESWYDMLGTVKEKIADAYYVEGLQAVGSNPDLAIELWQKGLMYNPSHTKTQMRLDSARQLKKNTKNIVDSDTN